MYPVWPGAACDWASEARWIATEAGFFMILKGTRRGQLKTADRRRITRLHDALFHKPSRSVGRASDVTSLDEPRAVQLSLKRRVRFDDVMSLTK
jgi:hypothetical protein